MSHNQTPLTGKHRLGYALGDFGGCMTFSLMSAFMTRYYVNVALMDTAVIAVMTLIWKIFDAVSEKYGVSKEDIYGTHRTKDIATARHVTIYLLRNLTDMSLPYIGRMFNRDHSTIMNSIDVVERRLRSDNLFVMDIAELKKIITGQNH